MSFSPQSPGLLGSLFVNACCLGASPILAALAAALGFSAFHSILNIYMLGPDQLPGVAPATLPNMSEKTKR